ncbi:MAG: phosphatase PAP2 family protein [Candidatus Berkelbacteria bacterium]|nr:MAG: phosphatase PAP2 family protein [Candidatus Berkelbacteria bacterium]QQG51626.1 MAG: phosphatase PAP2 family protein [Candidatus Berkelbacteria bacterium]
MGLLQVDTELTTRLFHWVSAHPALQQVFLTTASAFVYVLPLALLWLFFRTKTDRLNSIKVFLAAILSWQVLTNAVGGWLYGAYGFRDRPFALDGYQELFFERPQKAFPSDHAGVLTAVTLAFFAYRYPKLGWLFLVGGIVTSFGRVAVGFHYVGDIIGGIAIGGIAYGIIRLLDRPLDRILEKIFHGTNPS